MIAGHMDEVGLLVTQITKEGFVKFQTLGGWFSQVMLIWYADIPEEVTYFKNRIDNYNFLFYNIKYHIHKH